MEEVALVIMAPAARRRIRSVDVRATGTDVFIAGAGPTGLALAAALAARGVRAVVADPQAAGANTSRAAVLHARRRPVAQQVVALADRLTRLATMSRPLRPLRNAALHLLAYAPPFRRRLAWRLSGLVYRAR